MHLHPFFASCCGCLLNLQNTETQQINNKAKTICVGLRVGLRVGLFTQINKRRKTPDFDPKKRFVPHLAPHLGTQFLQILRNEKSVHFGGNLGGEFRGGI